MNRLLLSLILLTLCGASGVAMAQENPESDEAISTSEPGADSPAEAGDDPGEIVPEEALTAGPAPMTPHTICEGRRIRNIIVRGNRRVDARDVQANMRLRTGLPCTDAEVARDARALWDLGFFSDIRFDAEPAGDEIELFVSLRERPAIASIEFIGNDEVSEEDLDERVTLRDGAILSIPTVRRQVDRIRDLYAEEGYFLARVRYEFRVNNERGDEVRVRFLIDEGPEVEIRRIRFVGNANIPTDELLGIMQTSETGFFSFLSSNNVFNQESFDEDVNRLQAYYHEHGYLTVGVDEPLVELTSDRRHIDITIPVREGPRFRIADVSVAEVDRDGSAVDGLRTTDELREMVDAQSGEWLTRSRIALSLQDITRLYRDEGYARVQVTPETDMDMEDHTVGLRILIARGPQVTIERINIRGNQKTRDLVIRREIDLNEGDLYSMTALEEARMKITRLGYFERVDVTEERGSTPDRMVINVEVVERSTGTFQVGAGFSSIESIILNAQIQQNNFMGRGQSLALQLQLSGIRQYIQTRFVEPWFLGSRWQLSVDAARTSQQYADFTRNSTGGGFGVSHPLGRDELRLSARYRADLVDIQPRTGGVFTGSGAAGFNIYQQLPIANLFRDGLTSSLRLSLTWNSVNNYLLPTDGVHTSLATEVADRFLGSQNIFVRNSFFLRYYREAFDFLVMKANFNLGLITSRDPNGVPVFERFFLGGIYSVRGFPLNSLGPRAGLPRAIDPNASVSPFGVAIGGNMQAYYNLEVEFPILESVGIRGVVFTDGGNAWNLEDALCQAPRTELDDPTTDPCGVNLTEIRTSWGFGFRWQSPLGPLRFEWGLPFRARSHEEPIRFEFTIGNFF